MPADWPFAETLVALGGATPKKSNIKVEDGARQQETAQAILAALESQPGVILADEVGMGKTYVALAVIASVLVAEKGSGRPVIVMTPPGLTAKWAREWAQFISLCCRKPEVLSRVRTGFARNPAEFFKALDDSRPDRPRLIWMTTGCFSRGLQDPWIKLALIRLARSKTRMDDAAKRRLWKWGASLVRLKHHARLTREVIERLLNADLTKWHQLLIEEGILNQSDDDPIPEHLLRHAGELDFRRLATLLRGELPGGRGVVSVERERSARAAFNKECQIVYWQWVACARWRAPLLVLDEAHHAKNDQTRLASLLRSEDSEKLVGIGADVKKHPLLWDKFDRMLFLTATPFQLGHQELIRVLKSFGGAKWTGPGCPDQTRGDFFHSMDELERRLDTNRLAGKHLDRLWGQVTWTQVGAPAAEEADATTLDRWWQRVASGVGEAFETELLRAVEDCRRTKRSAEWDPKAIWASLRTWVIRHNRSKHLLVADGRIVPRRLPLLGAAIGADGTSLNPESSHGLSIPSDSAMPFLLAARAQGELAAGTAKTRAYFAEGLCSSYEAFHHTREQRGDIRDVNDDGAERTDRIGKVGRVESLVPLSWYEAQIEHFVPSKRDAEEARFRHPKLEAVVRRTVSLWESGEKVLLFCFYRETAKALRTHLRREVAERTQALVARKLGLVGNQGAVIDRIESISRRLSDQESPFYESLDRLLRSPFEGGDLDVMRDRENELVRLLMASLRTPAFIARYLPLEDPGVRAALAEGEKRASVARVGAEAMARAISEQADSSGVTMMRRVEEFYAFAKELAERAQVRLGAADEDDTEPIDPLDEYLKAVAVYVSPSDEDENEDEAEKKPGTIRMLSAVRMVFGATKNEVRQRLMLAFNSPLFPEILISSAVLGEGVDLHRFCRYVIHHDLCWNPSTLEQRTGRLDRIRCKAEWIGEPIVVYEPFLAGSADEKMFRVVRDRERWFQIVMGQKFEFDERSSEEVAGRVPLPERLAGELIFDLARHHPGVPSERSTATRVDFAPSTTRPTDGDDVRT